MQLAPLNDEDNIEALLDISDKVHTDGKPEKKLAALRWIVNRRQYKVVDGVLVDGFTASAILQVHDALSEANRAKLLSFPMARIGDITWKLVGKCGA